ncbi:MAG TPA: glycogen debranching protein GlgX, partial [Saprospiraceae bacterium]|nr:glycogen debranching protein GlgX [Saprospiraceae bacterium]
NQQNAKNVIYAIVSTLIHFRMNTHRHKTFNFKQPRVRTYYPTHAGKSYPLGATVYPEGVNFSIFSKNSEGMELWLFHDADDAQPFQVIRLDPAKNRSFYYWHVFVEELGPETLYGYKVYGKYDPAAGHRFDGEKLLLDPYARAVIAGKNYNREAAVLPGENTPFAVKGVVIDPKNYDWEDDRSPNHPYSKSVIYELHVKGFTMHPSSGLSSDERGTYSGLTDKIPYLKDLGVTAVELMPVFQFDESEVHSPLLKNYWGYSPLAFFAPHSSYCHTTEPQVIANEFRDMVKAFHKAGIEVILDVVFNHTTEGNHLGPVFSFKGLENSFYYILSENKEYYLDFTGTGNTLNSNHSIVRMLILDALKRWVTEMHVDGFRFDLAAVMSRDEHGNPISNPPILWEIEADPVLAQTKIIAEAWDTGGLYKLGSFIGDKWAEWNGQFRDDVRRFLRGDEGVVSLFASNIAGSLSLFKKPFRDPNRSINFITCHDGFTLNDLVSYKQKHNDANGEGGRDGADENYSDNYGVEGPTDDPEIEALRLRQIKNFFTILLLSQGTPMISMGDEVRRTQHGNNNAYCQDNETNWFNWDDAATNGGLLEFVKKLIRFRKRHPVFQMEKYWAINDDDAPDIKWHGVKPDEPDWRTNSHSLAYSLLDATGNHFFHFIVNAFWEPLEFELPPLDKEGKKWYPLIDTFQEHPQDFILNSVGTVNIAKIRVSPRTVVVLEAR